MKDSLGDRIKAAENAFKYTLLKRAYTIIRLDGKAFHTYCKGLKRPYDKGLVEDMQATTKYLCENVQGCKLGYVQSDEISLILTDFDEYSTQSWFDNEVQKMCSISASYATSKFNQLRFLRAVNTSPLNSNDFLKATNKLANFDSRIFQLPTLTEVNNYLLWRQRDCIKNNISTTAMALYSHSELNKKSGSEKQEMIFKKGAELQEIMINNGYDVNLFTTTFNWNDMPADLKRGTTFMKQEVKKQGANGLPVIRKVWVGSPFEFNSSTKDKLGILDNSTI